MQAPQLRHHTFYKARHIRACSRQTRTLPCVKPQLRSRCKYKRHSLYNSVCRWYSTSYSRYRASSHYRYCRFCFRLRPQNTTADIR